MWVATHSGLIQYNGVDFTIHTHDASNPNSLPGNKVQAICIDANGNIWAGTIKGLSRFDPASGVFRNYAHIPGDSSSLSDDVVNAVMEDHEKNLWVATNKGVDRLDKTTGKFRHFYSKASDQTT